MARSGQGRAQVKGPAKGEVSLSNNASKLNLSSTQSPRSVAIRQHAHQGSQQGNNQYTTASTHIRRSSEEESEDDDNESDESESIEEEEDEETETETAQANISSSKHAANVTHLAAVQGRGHSAPGVSQTDYSGGTSRAVTGQPRNGSSNNVPSSSRQQAKSPTTLQARSDTQQSSGTAIGLVFEVNKSDTTDSFWDHRLLVVVAQQDGFLTVATIHTHGERTSRTCAAAEFGRPVVFIASSGEKGKNADRGVNSNSLTIDLRDGSFLPPPKPKINFGQVFDISPRVQLRPVGAIRDVSQLRNTLLSIQARHSTPQPPEKWQIPGGRIMIVPSREPTHHPCLQKLSFPIRALYNTFLYGHVLFDPGATSDFIAPSTVEMVGAKMKRLSRPEIVKVPGGSDPDVSGYAQLQFSFQRGGSRVARTFYVLPWLEDVGWHAVLGCYTLDDFDKLGFSINRSRKDKEDLILSTIFLPNQNPNASAATTQGMNNAATASAAEIAARQRADAARLLAARGQHGTQQGTSSDQSNSGSQGTGSGQSK